MAYYTFLHKTEHAGAWLGHYGGGLGYTSPNLLAFCSQTENSFSYFVSCRNALTMLFLAQSPGDCK